jgi:hypothetical protein
MNEKIKKLSSKMIGIFPSKDLSAQEMYVHLRDIMKNQKDYFVLLKEEDIIKLTIYLYSLHKTGKYELGDKILNNIFFAVLVNPSDTYYTDTCPECDGNGNIRCDECDGSGNERCSECDGKGKVDCPDCDGSGEEEEGNPCPECQGGGEVECDECDGDGEVTCGYCGGDGEQRCSECDGTGEVETGDKYYTIYKE